MRREGGTPTVGGHAGQLGCCCDWLEPDGVPELLVEEPEDLSPDAGGVELGEEPEDLPDEELPEPELLPDFRVVELFL